MLERPNKWWAMIKNELRLQTNMEGGYRMVLFIDIPDLSRRTIIYMRMPYELRFKECFVEKAK